MALSELVKNARMVIGLSARKLASRIGVSHSYISQVESGLIRKPSLSVLRRLAAALPGISYWRLLEESGYAMGGEGRKSGLGVDDGVSAATAGKGERGEVREVIFRKLYEAAESIAKAPGALVIEPQTGAGMRAVPLFTSIPASFGQSSGTTVGIYDEFEVVHLHESRLNHDPACFALRVKGDSMIEAGILPGDIVVVSPNTPYQSGDVCVVRINGGEHSLKRVLVRGDLIILQPANSKYDPEIIDNSKENDLFIYGKVIHVERSLI
ncbi:MAG: hypothetical protein B1H03_02725 [Planctomycetales bacterium 4484_113]|nr:MAG: hypothetical protein B1H03_02725 [Planctomycetales bacterium 4484_113]